MRRALLFLSSLKLTVALLALSLLLILFGTLDQVNIGIRGAQEKYFESVLAFWRYPPQWSGGRLLSWLHFPVAGGFLLGPLLVVNLTAAHFRHFRPLWSQAGIAAIHAGVVLILIGQLLAHLLQKEDYMWLDEGSSANFLESFSRDELAVIERTAPDHDSVFSIPAELLRDQPYFQHPKLPFRIEVKSFLPNARLARRSDFDEPPPPIANQGIAVSMDVVAQPIPRTFKQDERNATTAVIELVGTDGSLGTWLVSTVLTPDRFGSQPIHYENRRFDIALRHQRKYLPYSIELLDFTHDRYPGTEIPRNFSSKIRLTNEQTGEDRQTLIYMNHPLRYQGRTFFQASFAKQDTASMFQVVRNPGWLIPYISCILVSVGLIYQFMWHLVAFLRNHSKRVAGSSVEDK